MATSEIRGLQNIISSVWNEDALMRQMGYKRVEGLSFWVHDEIWLLRVRDHNRPFTKKQHRAYVREQRKLRWLRREREVRRRVASAWDVLRGREEVY